MAKHRVDIADTHARFVYGVRSSIGEVAQLAEQQTWYVGHPAGKIDSHSRLYVVGSIPTLPTGTRVYIVDSDQR